MATAQNHADTSSVSVNVHIQHQNGGKSLISATLSAAWLLVPDGLALNILEIADMLRISHTTV